MNKVKEKIHYKTSEDIRAMLKAKGYPRLKIRKGEIMKYVISWESLSNDKLLELWLRPATEAESYRGQIEDILKKRGVIKEG